MLLARGILMRLRVHMTKVVGLFTCEGLRTEGTGLTERVRVRAQQFWSGSIRGLAYAYFGSVSGGWPG